MAQSATLCSNLPIGCSLAIRSKYGSWCDRGVWISAAGTVSALRLICGYGCVCKSSRGSVRAVERHPALFAGTAVERRRGCARFWSKSRGAICPSSRLNRAAQLKQSSPLQLEEFLNYQPFRGSVLRVARRDVVHRGDALLVHTAVHVLKPSDRGRQTSSCD
jgi:hypothetical protein